MSLLHPSRQPGMAMAAIATLSVLLHGNCIDGFAPTAIATVHRETVGNNAIIPGAVRMAKLFAGSSDDPDRSSFDDGSGAREDNERAPRSTSTNEATTTPPSALWATLAGSGPPLQVDDTRLLIYDVFLLVNLSVCISFLVVHRMNVSYIPSGLDEGALLSLCWIAAGLANGSFLRSSVDGHYDLMSEEYEEKGGPKAAGLLAVSTYVGTSSLRIIVALAAAVAQHRRVGTGGEELIPLEILFGLVLMSAWRFLHSANTPRIG